MRKKIFHILLFILVCFMLLVSCNKVADNDLLNNLQSENSDFNDIINNNQNTNTIYTNENNINEDRKYSAPEDVSKYLHIYGKLPSNFITKKEAQTVNIVENTNRKCVLFPLSASL
ncbi:hypothetical protein SDC9_212333 [bioreactor metagenome]|uniref:Lipoprotein n=1 Tax=bioreactor metagenome TaxID=1076179 RepID=A0A645JLL7_9ZZZZ